MLFFYDTSVGKNGLGGSHDGFPDIKENGVSGKLLLSLVRDSSSRSFLLGNAFFDEGLQVALSSTLFKAEGFLIFGAGYWACFFQQVLVTFDFHRRQSRIPLCLGCRCGSSWQGEDNVGVVESDLREREAFVREFTDGGEAEAPLLGETEDVEDAHDFGVAAEGRRRERCQLFQFQRAHRSAGGFDDNEIVTDFQVNRGAFNIIIAMQNRVFCELVDDLQGVVIDGLALGLTPIYLIADTEGIPIIKSLWLLGQRSLHLKDLFFPASRAVSGANQSVGERQLWEFAKEKKADTGGTKDSVRNIH